MNFKISEKNGDKLVCVRYKYDINKKTVELILSREYWNPETSKILRIVS